MHLLTGATGYIGGRLLRRLQRDGLAVRCLCRNPEALGWRAAPGTELVRGDLLQPAFLGMAFSGVDTAFYLVHSMKAGDRFEADERAAASNFAAAARDAGVRRIIYLGGLAHASRVAHGAELSRHMRSRAETGNILRSSGVPVIELQASIVIGSGSASFEMMRALVERLPVMLTPRWVNTAAQPIAIEDVIEYLVEAARMPAKGNLTFEIGGADVTSYLGIMREYARQRKLHRWIARRAAYRRARPGPRVRPRVRGLFETGEMRSAGPGATDRRRRSDRAASPSRIGWPPLQAPRRRQPPRPRRRCARACGGRTRSLPPKTRTASRLCRHSCRRAGPMLLPRSARVPANIHESQRNIIRN